MMRFYFLFCLVLSTSIGGLFAQNQEFIELSWLDSKPHLYNDSLVETVSFKDAFYSFEEHNFPIFKKKIRLPENVLSAQVLITSLDSSLFSALDLNLLSSDLPNSPLKWRISYERKIPYLIFSFIPLTASHKINQFSYTLNLTYSDFDINAKRTSNEK